MKVISEEQNALSAVDMEQLAGIESFVVGLEPLKTKNFAAFNIIDGYWVGHWEQFWTPQYTPPPPKKKNKKIGKYRNTATKLLNTAIFQYPLELRYHGETATTQSK